MQNDKEIVKIAVNNNCDAYKYASSDLKSDKDIVKSALSAEKITCSFINQIPPSILKDEEILSLCLQQEEFAEQWAGIVKQRENIKKYYKEMGIDLEAEKNDNIKEN